MACDNGAMFVATARGLIAHALPILVAQLSSIGMMLVDTVVLGHVSAVDLAAVAIGGGLHVSVIFALAGILQAVAPVVAHLQERSRTTRWPVSCSRGSGWRCCSACPVSPSCATPTQCWP